jgi:hypothetical protein
MLQKQPEGGCGWRWIEEKRKKLTRVGRWWNAQRVYSTGRTGEVDKYEAAKGRYVCKMKRGFRGKTRPVVLERSSRPPIAESGGLP